jgi:hypothetical protein
MFNGLYKYKCIYLLLLLFPMIFTLIDKKNTAKYYFCNKKIYDPDMLLSQSSITTICSRIGDDNLILIGIQRNIPLPTTYLSKEDEDNFYTRDTEELFIKQCGKISSYTCDFGYLFSIYTDGRKARLTAGRHSQNKLSNNYRQNILNSVKSNMSNGQFPDAIIKVVDQFKSLLNGSYINDYDEPRTVTPTPPQNYPYQSENSGNGWTEFFVIIILVACVACCFFAYQRYQNETNLNITRINYNHQHVYHHLHKLETLLKEVRNCTPPLVSINKCLLCMDTMYGLNNPGAYYEMNNISTTNNDMRSNLLQQPNLTRLQCGHLYHTTCLEVFGLGCCLMCEPDFNARIKTANLSNEHIVDEIQIRKFISNFNRIYGKEVVDEYVRYYPDDYSSTMAVVGLSSFAAGALVASAMMDHHNYGGYNQYNTYNYYDPSNNNPGYGYNGPSNNIDLGNSGGNTGGDLDTAEVDF